MDAEHIVGLVTSVVGAGGGILGMIAFARAQREHGWRKEDRQKQLGREAWERDTLSWGEDIRREIGKEAQVTVAYVLDAKEMERARFLQEKKRARIDHKDGSDYLVFDDLTVHQVML